ncbi:antibiotic biosynthesis monooxygenase family protein [Kitasatospora kifunensis]|uniref:Heme-degrading monooxygenase HmoA n=1 Tax=Kitasatospora kifunensis TaxID=58351 RepID=A0A7W7VYJ2_KITKI|nr:antibiotic biosynthesis monooxygenase [Kitasatospora kifunensis]MBB4927103.1 heme-degrading monooxygenase HmoA [Kitasatospora kifunensis]
MIVRIWEARVAPKLVSEFCAVVQSELLPPLVGLDGYLGGELLRSLPGGTHRVLVVTRWRDEEALRGYAGPMWAKRPVWSDDEQAYLEHPPEVAHFTLLSTA